MQPGFRDSPRRSQSPVSRPVRPLRRNSLGRLSVDKSVSSRSEQIGAPGWSWRARWQGSWQRVFHARGPGQARRLDSIRISVRGASWRDSPRSKPALCRKGTSGETAVVGAENDRRLRKYCTSLTLAMVCRPLFDRGADAVARTALGAMMGHPCVDVNFARGPLRVRPPPAGRWS